MRYTNIRELERHAGVGSPLRSFVDIIVHAVEALEDRVEVLFLGIDGQRYSDFEWMTPAVWKSGGDYRVDDRWQRQGPPISKAKAKWCIEFVIEVALKLQGAARVL